MHAVVEAVSCYSSQIVSFFVFDQEAFLSIGFSRARSDVLETWHESRSKCFREFSLYIFEACSDKMIISFRATSAWYGLGHCVLWSFVAAKTSLVLYILICLRKH